jgi:hypothetical protein
MIKNHKNTPKNGQKRRENRAKIEKKWRDKVKKIK